MTSTKKYLLTGLGLLLLIFASCAREQPVNRQTAPDTPAASGGAAAAQPADTAKSKPSLRIQETTVEETLEGTLYVSGNEPFTHLTLGLEKNKSVRLSIDSTRMKQLWQLQGRRIRVTGTVKKSPLGNEVVVRGYTVVE